MVDMAKLTSKNSSTVDYIIILENVSKIRNDLYSNLTEIYLIFIVQYTPLLLYKPADIGTI